MIESRASIHSDAMNQALKPLKDIINTLNDRVNCITRELRCLSGSKYGLFGYNDG